MGLATVDDFALGETLGFSNDRELLEQRRNAIESELERDLKHLADQQSAVVDDLRKDRDRLATERDEAKAEWEQRRDEVLRNKLNMPVGMAAKLGTFGATATWLCAWTMAAGLSAPLRLEYTGLLAMTLLAWGAVFGKGLEYLRFGRVLLIPLYVAVPLAVVWFDEPRSTPVGHRLALVLLGLVGPLATGISWMALVNGRPVVLLRRRLNALERKVEHAELDLQDAWRETAVARARRQASATEHVDDLHRGFLVGCAAGKSQTAPRGAA